MHKIIVIRLYFSLNVLHVSDCISPSSGAAFISCTSHLVYASICRYHKCDCCVARATQQPHVWHIPAYTKCDVQLIKVAPDDGLIQSETCRAFNEEQNLITRILCILLVYIHKVVSNLSISKVTLPVIIYFCAFCTRFQSELRAGLFEGSSSHHQCLGAPLYSTLKLERVQPDSCLILGLLACMKINDCSERGYRMAVYHWNFNSLKYILYIA